MKEPNFSKNFPIKGSEWDSVPYWFRKNRFQVYVTGRIFEAMWDEGVDIEDLPKILMEIANDIAKEIKEQTL